MLKLWTPTWNLYLIIWPHMSGSCCGQHGQSAGPKSLTLFSGLSVPAFLWNCLHVSGCLLRTTLTVCRTSIPSATQLIGHVSIPMQLTTAVWAVLWTTWEVIGSQFPITPSSLFLCATWTWILIPPITLLPVQNSQTTWIVHRISISKTTQQSISVCHLNLEFHFSNYCTVRAEFSPPLDNTNQKNLIQRTQATSSHIICCQTN